MSKSIFITGTGTDVGKTYVTGLLVKKLKDAGLNSAYFKAAMSGNDRDEKGNLIPGDAKFVKDISGIDQPLRTMCPYIYETAVSPHLASRIEGNPVKLSVVKDGYNKIINSYDYVAMEGSGGILCPIEFDNERLYLVDIIKEFNLSTIMIADAGLGTINSVVLTYEYMKAHDISCKGIIYNHYHKGNVMEDDNIFMCEQLTGLETLARVSDEANELDIDIDKLVSLFEEERL